MSEQLVFELLKEIKDMRVEFMCMRRWFEFQYESFRIINEQQAIEIRSLLIEVNVLVAKLKERKSINKHF